MIDPETKKVIDEMDYESMLRKWRFALGGSPMFQGETGYYYSEVMARKRENLLPGEHAIISKRIGWRK